MTTSEHDLTIGDVAERTGLSVHALRFYEREALLVGEVRRDDGGRRRYSPSDVAWIELVTKLRASGMPLADVRRFAELVREGPGNEHERLQLLRDHQQRVAAQLQELQDCMDVIAWKVQVYDEHLSRGEATELWTGTATDAAGRSR